MTVSTLNVNDSPARIDPEQATIGRPTQTARRLVEASVSPNTRRAYAGARRRLDAWLDGREFHDVTLAAYLAELHDAGRASATASMAPAAHRVLGPFILGTRRQLKDPRLGIIGHAFDKHMVKQRPVCDHLVRGTATDEGLRRVAG